MSEEIREEMIEGAEEAAGTEEQAGVQSENKQEPEKKYTDADVDRIIAKKIAAERKRMSKLFNEEQQESEIEVRERNVMVRELKADAKDALISDGLPISLANVLNYNSKEDMEASYAEITKVFKEALQQAAIERFRGPVPKASSTVPKGETAIKEAFAPKTR